MKSKNEWNKINGVIVPKELVAKHLGITRPALDKRVAAGLSEKDIRRIERFIWSLGADFFNFRFPQ